MLNRSCGRSRARRSACRCPSSRRPRPVRGHRREQDAQVLERVAEELLAGVPVRLAVAARVRRARRGSRAGQVVAQPLPVRSAARVVRLQLLVGDDAPFGGVDQEHAARLQPPLVLHVFLVDGEHAALGRQHDEAVLGHPVAGRAQAVAVEDRADPGAVGEGDRGRAVPGLHQALVVLVEGLLLVAHQRIAIPGLGDQHHHRVRDVAARQDQELEHVVDHARVGGVGVHERQDLRQVVAPDPERITASRARIQLCCRARC